MHLNLPDHEAFGKKTLFVGAGGGYDYLGAIPLEHELTTRDVPAFTWHEDLSRAGVAPLRATLQAYINEGGYETLVLVDGGVDILMRGDERSSGTLLEDAVALTAAYHVEIPHKIVACFGFGSETDEGLCHYRALENMSSLMSTGHFIGSCSLTSMMPAYQEYKRRCEEEWKGRRKSHIHTKILPAVAGAFGDLSQRGVEARVVGGKDRKPFASPLMGIYWFFDLDAVYHRNLFAEGLKKTATRTDTLMVYRQFLGTLSSMREDQPIPL